MRLEAGLFVLFSFVFGVAQLYLIVRSLRSGVIEWSTFGRKVRAPGDYDFWVVLMLHGIIAVVFMGVAALLISGARQ